MGVIRIVAVFIFALLLCQAEALANEPTLFKIEDLKAKAQRGDTEAMVTLGGLYTPPAPGAGRWFTQPEIDPDDRVSFEWYSRAAAAGDRVGQWLMANRQIRGQGTPMDPAAGERRRQAAEAGFTSKDKRRLGWLFNDGMGLPHDRSAAARWFTSAAEEGDPEGMFAMALLEDEGGGFRFEARTAASHRWLQRAAEAGHAQAALLLGEDFAQAPGPLYDQPYYDEREAERWLRTAAERGATSMPLAELLSRQGRAEEAYDFFVQAAEVGDFNAARWLARAHATGRGAPQNDEAAIAWKIRARAPGAPDMTRETAMVMLGIDLQGAEGLRWLRLAAEADHPLGLTFLGQRLLGDASGETNVAEGLRLLQRAADLGAPDAMATLARAYGTGQAVDKDVATAAEWLFREAAARGTPFAWIDLGQKYEMGILVPKDAAKAAEFYQRALTEGSVHAAMRLAALHERGEGVARSDAMACRYYALAAPSERQARRPLAECYDTGRGVEPDRAEAVRWYRKAAYDGDQIAIQRLLALYDAGEPLVTHEEAARLRGS